jgi:phage virion morphogenesis protein
MALGARVNIVSDSPVVAILQSLVIEGAAKNKLLGDIGAAAVEGARLRFNDQVSPDGKPWIPSYRAKAQGGQTLRDTGRLVNELNHEVAGDSVFYGSNLHYAAPLHFGAQIKATGGLYLKFKIAGRFYQKKEVTLPPRPFLGISKDDEQSVLEVIQDFMEQKIS